MSAILFIEYPKCSTCQKAKKWLEDHHISFTDRNIVTETPSADELKKWSKEIPLKSLFNTSGLKYKALGLKDKLPTLSDDEKFDLLASDGMLIKRPLIIGNNFTLTGFKEKIWEEKLL